MKKLFTLFAALCAMVCSSKAEEQLMFYTDNGGEFDFAMTVNMAAAHNGQWKTLLWNQRDLRNYDYVWLVYKNAEGDAMKFGVKYSEFLSEASYGELYAEVSVPIESVSGVVGVQLDHETVMVNGFREQKQLANGSYEYTFTFQGDVYSQHVNQCYVQTALPGASIDIVGVYAGSKAEFEAATGKGNPVTNITVSPKTDGQVRSVATGKVVGPDFRGLVVKDGVKYIQK